MSPMKFNRWRIEIHVNIACKSGRWTDGPFAIVGRHASRSLSSRTHYAVKPNTEGSLLSVRVLCD